MIILFILHVLLLNCFAMSIASKSKKWHNIAYLCNHTYDLTKISIERYGITEMTLRLQIIIEQFMMREYLTTLDEQA